MYVDCVTNAVISFEIFRLNTILLLFALCLSIAINPWKDGMKTKAQEQHTHTYMHTKHTRTQYKEK